MEKSNYENKNSKTSNKIQNTSESVMSINHMEEDKFFKQKEKIKLSEKANKSISKAGNNAPNLEMQGVNTNTNRSIESKSILKDGIDVNNKSATSKYKEENLMLMKGKEDRSPESTIEKQKDLNDSMNFAVPLKIQKIKETIANESNRPLNQGGNMNIDVEENQLQNKEIQPRKILSLQLKDPSNSNDLKNKMNSSKLLKKEGNSNSSAGQVCKICYDGETEEKGGLITPCLCTGSCKFIHESCLKKWIENNFASNKIKAECEICKSSYNMRFYMKNRFSKPKMISSLKSLAALTIVATVILTLIFTVIYVIVSSLSTMSEEGRQSFINILVGIASGLLLVIIIFSFKNCKSNYYEQVLCEWKIFNYEGIIY
jgi:hypothetical protein